MERRSVQRVDNDSNEIEVSREIATTSGIGQDNIGDINRLLGEDYVDEESRTIYDTNNALIDRPMKKDLNSILTVECLADYWLEVVDRCLKDESELEPDLYDNWLEEYRPKPFMD